RHRSRWIAERARDQDPERRGAIGHDDLWHRHIELVLDHHGSGPALDRCRNKRVTIRAHSAHRDIDVTGLDRPRITLHRPDGDPGIPEDASACEVIDESTED